MLGNAALISVWLHSNSEQRPPGRDVAGLIDDGGQGKGREGKGREEKRREGGAVALAQHATGCEGEYREAPRTP